MHVAMDFVVSHAPTLPPWCCKVLVDIVLLFRFAAFTDLLVIDVLVKRFVVRN